MFNALIALIARRFAAMSAVCAALVLLPVPAWAGGGAHIVDDDAVIDPGVCHAENWVTLSESAQRGLAKTAPACTFRQLPGVEIALGYQHDWDDGTANLIVPSVKLNILPAANGFGIAVSGTATIDAASGGLQDFALVLPVTVPIRENLLIHGNIGYIVEPGTDDINQLFWGGHIEYHLRPNLQVMAEVFGRDRGPPGGQAGLRWIVDKGRIDIDLIAGHRIDGPRINGIDETTVTLGFTIRR